MANFAQGVAPKEGRRIRRCTNETIFCFCVGGIRIADDRPRRFEGVGLQFQFWCADVLELIEYLGSLFPDQEAVGDSVLRFR